MDNQNLEIGDVKKGVFTRIDEIPFKWRGLPGTAIVRNWNEKNMSIQSLDLTFSYTRSEFKEIVDALFDEAEDTADLREQDHQDDARFSGEEE